MEDVIFSVTIASDSDSIEISGNSVFRPREITGFDCGDYNIITSRNMLLDGDYIHGRRIDSRLLNISFEVFPMSESEKYRKRLISFFNPKKDFTVTVIRGNIKRSIKCVLKSAKLIQPTLRSAVAAEAVFLCPNPFFAGKSETLYSAVTTVPLFSFPFNSVQNYGITMGKSYQTNVFNVENFGDTDIGINVTLYAGGEVVNPSVNCGGKYVKILDTMVNGDSYFISTESGNKRIEKNGEGNFCFDRLSEFFTIPVGSSIVTVTADSGIEKIRTVFSYEERYLGV